MATRCAKARRHAVADPEKQDFSIGPSLLKWFQGNCKPGRSIAFGQMKMKFDVSRGYPDQAGGNDEQRDKSLATGH
jgi:hypothetical protein